MSASRTVAKDTIQALINTVVVAEGLHAAYENTDNGYLDQKLSSLEPWVRINIRHTTGTTRTLGGVGGTRRHEEGGLVIVEVMTPTGGGTVQSDMLSAAFVSAFRVRSAHNEDVWYSDVSNREAGQDDGWYKTNVVAEFHYDLIE